MGQTVTAKEWRKMVRVEITMRKATVNERSSEDWDSETNRDHLGAKSRERLMKNSLKGDTIIYVSDVINDIYYIHANPEVMLHPVIVELELRYNFLPIETLDNLLNSPYVKIEDKLFLQTLLEKYTREEDNPILELQRQIRESRGQ